MTLNFQIFALVRKKYSTIFVHSDLKSPFINFSINRNTKFYFQKALGLLHFGSCQNCLSSANLVAEIHLKLWNKRALSIGEPCTSEYVTLLQWFHRGTLSIYWCIAQNFWSTFSMSVLFRRSLKTAILSRFLKVAKATSNFMIEVIKKERKKIDSENDKGKCQ